VPKFHSERTSTLKNLGNEIQREDESRPGIVVPSICDDFVAERDEQVVLDFHGLNAPNTDGTFFAWAVKTVETRRR
jgi:hypothetical protein